MINIIDQVANDRINITKTVTGMTKHITDIVETMTVDAMIDIGALGTTVIDIVEDCSISLFVFNKVEVIRMERAMPKMNQRAMIQVIVRFFIDVVEI